MKKIFLIIQLFVAIGGLLCFLLCTEIPITNPNHSLFEGDYRFQVTWDSLHNVYNDTLEIFRKYTIDFKVIGEHRFKSIKVCNANGLLVTDSTLLNNEKTNSTIILYFRSTFQGVLYLIGMRPNGKVGDSDTCPFEVSVVNPYRLVSDTLAGAEDAVESRIITIRDSLTIPDSLKTIWKVNDSIVDTLILSESFTYTYSNSGLHTVSGTLLDSYGYSLWIDTAIIRILGYSPKIESVSLNGTATIGDTLSFTIKLHDKDSNSIAVSIKAGDSLLVEPDTYYKYNTLYIIKAPKPIIDTGEVVFSVYLIDSTELKSEVKTFSERIHYKLPAPEFPADILPSIPIRDTFPIPCYDSNYEEGTKYVWEVKRHKIIDTTNSADSFSIFLLDTLPDTVTVKGTNRFGLHGEMDMMIVMARHHEYTIEPVDFPNTVLWKRVSEFIVCVKDSNDSIITEDVEYTWEILPDSGFDTLLINNTCKASFSDSSNSFEFKVKAVVDNKDTTNELLRIIIVKAETPVCRFKSKEYSGKVGDTIPIDIHAEDRDTIKGIFLKFLPYGEIIQLGMDSTFDTSFIFPDTYTITTWAEDNDGFLSILDSAKILVTSDKPFFKPDSLDTFVFINDTLSISVNAEPGNQVSAILWYYWDIDADGLWDDSAKTGGFDTVFTQPGSYTAYAGCKNDLGDTALKRFRLSVSIDEGKPRIISASLDTSWTYINDAVTLAVEAKDTNGVISQFYIDTTGDSIEDIIVSGNNQQRDTIEYDLSFPNPGIYPVTVWVEDDDTVLSEKITVEDSLVVDPGTPQVSGLLHDTVWIKDSVSYTISAIDNKTIANYAWSLDSITFTSLGEVNTFKHAFADSGLFAVFLKVMDDDGNPSPVRKESVYVRYGAPVVDSFSKDTVWVNDPDSYTFYFHDTNDSVISIIVNWGDGSPNSLASDVSGNSASIIHAYPVTNDMSYTITATVTDNDGITASGSFPVHVKLGKPKIDSVRIDASANSIFVVDAREYRVYASDMNGYVKKVYVSWSGAGTPDDSILISENSNTIDKAFTKSFTTQQSGSRTIRFWIKDEDGISSDNEDMAIDVRLGAPELWGDTLDTLWIIVDSGYRKYSYGPNYYDTNGTIQRFYFCLTDDTTNVSYKGALDNDSISIDQFNINEVAGARYIYGKDDDGILGGKQFVVYADSVPVKPAIVAAPEGDSVKIMWSGKDYKDGDATQYRIILKQGAPPDSADILVDFKAGTEYSPGDSGKDFKYSYKTGTSGLEYYYKVVARDGRGSMVYSNEGTFIFP